MAVTMKDVLNLDIMRNFKIMAGENGLDRTITATEILDFEFMQEGEEYRQNSFTGNSLVLSSLLFAKDDPSLILVTIKKLIAQNVQALAYKPVFFKELPEEALAYANERNFPILEFAHDEFFEEILFSIRDLVERDDIVLRTETLLTDMLTREFSIEEDSCAQEKINPLLRPVKMVICMSVKGVTGEQISDFIKRVKPNQKLRSKTFVGKLANRFFVVLSQDELNLSRFKAQLDDVCIAYGLMGKEITAGVSAPVMVGGKFDEAVRQAFWSEKVAEIEKIPVKYYEKSGIYRLIIPNMHSQTMAVYMEDYLAPIFEEEDKDGELLRTAIEYIFAKGDTIETAERLYCHKNTIRYRIGKLQEKLDPDSNEKEFYQNLAAAIKIYLLMNQD